MNQNSSAARPPSSRRYCSATLILSSLLTVKFALGFLTTTRPSHSGYIARTKFRSPSEDQQQWLPRAIPGEEKALKVWWFGGTESREVNGDDESCELVAVRIDRTSANSRRIAGEITVPAKLDDVWSILTDYDRLAIHVPNLMESRIIERKSGGEPGDGNFRCRLFQKGAQKIIGFDFSASVTMDMTEQIVNNREHASKERSIGFKCVDSQFFNVFDGRWNVKERTAADGTPETVCSYFVDVRPKGPVPVAALEWRIREDVPTNLRAVKAATIRINAPNTLPLTTTKPLGPLQEIKASQARAITRGQQPRLISVLSDWDRDETMGKYL